MNPLSWLNGRLSAVEKTFILAFALAGVWFFANGTAFYNGLFASATSANLLQTSLLYYFFDPFELFLLYFGFRFFHGLRGVLNMAVLTISYDLMFYKGPGSFSDLLVANFQLLPNAWTVLGVSLNALLLVYVLPLLGVIAVAVNDPTFFDELFALSKFKK